MELTKNILLKHKVNFFILSVFSLSYLITEDSVKHTANSKININVFQKEKLLYVYLSIRIRFRKILNICLTNGKP